MQFVKATTVGTSAKENLEKQKKTRKNDIKEVGI